MGDKVPSVRTLDSGDRVRHYPDGTQVLIHNDTRHAAVHDRQQELEDAHAELNRVHLDKIEARHKSLGSGRPVPHEKRSI